MPFVERNEEGNIVGLFACQQQYAIEYLEDDDPQVKTFRRAQEGAQAQRSLDIEGSLPTWTSVAAEIDAIASLTDAKALIKKLARVVYWLAKNQAE
jgi:hypothetical protein